MTELALTQDYVIEYIRANFELLDDEEQGMTHWLAQMYTFIEEWRFDEAQQLIRAIKRLDLSTYAVGQFYLGVGDFHRQQQAWATAAQAYQRALTNFRQLNKRQDEAMALNNLALTFQEQQDYAKAVGCYEDALNIYETSGDMQSIGHVFINLGSVADAQTDWQRAIAYYQRGVEYLEQAEAQDDLPKALNNLGVAFESLGDLAKAEHYYMRCVDLLDELGQSYSSDGTRILVNLGQLYTKRVVWDEAINCYQRALEICQEIEDFYGESTTWNNLGTVYTARTDYAQAAQCYGRSVELHNRLGNRQGEALALSNLGAAYEDMGEFALAETCYHNSLALSQDLDDAYGKARSYNNLGVLDEKRGQHDNAIAHYKQCADILRELGDGHREVTTLINICTLYEVLLQTEKARPYFDRAWQVAENREYVDHLTSLCMLKGDAAFQYRERFAEAGDWCAKACQYAARLNPQTLDKVVQHIYLHLERLQRQAQGEQLRAFCVKLLQVWTDEPLSQLKPEFVQTLRELTAKAIHNVKE
jgi:tetratricopeptide (TPR) repeat protein